MQAVPEEFCGNLVVFPGSHTLVAEATRDPSTMDLLRREGTFFGVIRSRCLHAPHTRAGMPALHDKLPVVSKPLQIIAEAGDVLVAHSSLPHSVAPNVSSSIRYALYFRVNSSSRCGCGWTGWRLVCVIVVKHATLQGQARHRRRRPRPFAGHVRPLAPLATCCLARIAYALSSTCGCAGSEIFCGHKRMLWLHSPTLLSPQVTRLTAEANAAWSEIGDSKEKWARALAAYAALQLLRPQDFEVGERSMIRT